MEHETKVLLTRAKNALMCGPVSAMRDAVVADIEAALTHPAATAKAKQEPEKLAQPANSSTLSNSSTVPEGCVLTPDGVLRKVLGTLPLTKDGAIVIGERVELWHPDYPDAGKTGAWQSPPNTCRFYFPDQKVRLMNTWRDVPVAHCYSTKESAQQAAGGREGP